MELWMVVTVGAAFLQNVRSTLQKHLKSVMGTSGATFVRFGFGLPVAAIYLAVTMAWLDVPLPRVSSTFLVWVVVGATAQILATGLLVHLFSYRSFTVGSAYSRTEPVQTAIFAAVLFGAEFETTAVVSIAIAVAGIMAVSVSRSAVTPTTLILSVFRRTALIGLAAGTLFGLAAVGFQQAARSLAADHFVMQAAVTLVAGLAFQTVLMLAYLQWRTPDEFARIRAAWWTSAAVGFVGATATFGWFTAFTLQQAALVKVLAQVELLFSIGSGVLIFREGVDRMELVGCALIVASIVVLLL